MKLAPGNPISTHCSRGEHVGDAALEAGDGVHNRNPNLDLLAIDHRCCTESGYPVLQLTPGYTQDPVQEVDFELLAIPNRRDESCVGAIHRAAIRLAHRPI